MSRREATVWWAIAGTVAGAGVLAVLVRPLAPDPGAVETALDGFVPELLAAVGAYRAPRYGALLALQAVTVLVPALFVCTRPGRRLVERCARRIRRPTVAAALVAAMIALATAVAELPLTFWLTHVHERDWGFATAGVSVWLRDWAIVLGFVTVVAVVGASVFVAARRRWPATWHLRLVVVGTALTAVLTFGYPIVVQPLLLPTTPLADGDVKDAVVDVLERAGAGDVGVLVGDASRRTTKVNAFVTGIGPTRRMVLFDTMLELPPEHVAVVVAHELAHREHRDVARAVLVSATGLLVGLLVLRRLVGPDRAGRAVSDARAVAILAVVLAVGQVVVAPVANWTSRRAEAAADHRALELTGAAARFVATQRGFVARDLADPSPPGWSMALWGTHPTIEQRIRAAVAFARARDIPLPSREELEAAEPPPPTPTGGVG